MGSYSKKSWACPFYIWDERTCVHCEGNGKRSSCITFPDRRALDEYTAQYCTDAKGYKKCSIAINLSKYYDRIEKQ